MNSCATFYLPYNKRLCSSFHQTCNLQSFWSAAWDHFPSFSFWHFFTNQKKQTNIVNPLIALSRIYRESLFVKHVTVSRSEAVRFSTPSDVSNDHLVCKEWLQTVISEYSCYFTGSETSWIVSELIRVWCNTWPVLSLSVSVSRPPDRRERVGWRETAQTLGHQEGEDRVKNSFTFVLYFPVLLFLSRVLFLFL